TRGGKSAGSWCTTRRQLHSCRGDARVAVDAQRRCRSLSRLRRDRDAGVAPTGGNARRRAIVPACKIAPHAHNTAAVFLGGFPSFFEGFLRVRKLLVA